MSPVSVLTGLLIWRRGFLRRGTRQLFDTIREKRRARRERNRGRWRRKFRKLWNAARQLDD